MRLSNIDYFIDKKLGNELSDAINILCKFKLLIIYNN